MRLCLVSCIRLILFGAKFSGGAFSSLPWSCGVRRPAVHGREHLWNGLLRCFARPAPAYTVLLYSARHDAQLDWLRQRTHSSCSIHAVHCDTCLTRTMIARGCPDVQVVCRRVAGEFMDLIPEDAVSSLRRCRWQRRRRSRTLDR